MLIISHPSTLMGIENDTHQTRGGTTTIQKLAGIENDTQQLGAPFSANFYGNLA